MRKHNLFQSFLLIVDLVLSHGGYFWDQVKGSFFGKSEEMHWWLISERRPIEITWLTMVDQWLAVILTLGRWPLKKTLWTTKGKFLTIVISVNCIFSGAKLGSRWKRGEDRARKAFVAKHHRWKENKSLFYPQLLSDQLIRKIKPSSCLISW